MANEEIKKEKEGVANWRIAEQLGVSEQTVIRWFRTEMSEGKKINVLHAIKAAKEEGNE